MNEGQEVLKEISENWFGNIKVSLFWEEKILLIVRFAQYYGYLLLCFYEVFPFDFKEYWGRFFFFLIGSFQFMISQEQYYAVL